MKMGRGDGRDHLGGKPPFMIAKEECNSLSRKSKTEMKAAGQYGSSADSLLVIPSVKSS